MKPELNHDEIVFRVLLQREELRPNLTFASLEEVVPKTILKSLEGDWRSYIRNESLEFDIAFQKAVRKHIPGLHFIILAAEFLGKISFHAALGHFLQPDKFKGQANFREDDVFNLADRLEEEVRQKRARLIPQQRKVFAPPKFAPEPSGLTRKCYFCGRRIPAVELCDHIDCVHLNPSHLGGQANQPKNIQLSPIESKMEIADPIKQIIIDDVSTHEFGNFRRPCCACGNIAIPGDFYCYGCAPD
jgi:hypothetical protein